MARLNKSAVRKAGTSGFRGFDKVGNSLGSALGSSLGKRLGGYWGSRMAKKYLPRMALKVAGRMYPGLPFQLIPTLIPLYKKSPVYKKFKNTDKKNNPNINKKKKDNIKQKNSSKTNKIKKIRIKGFPLFKIGRKPR